jgi:hypothetical protein
MRLSSVIAGMCLLGAGAGASATVTCNGMPSLIACTGPAQEMVVDYLVTQLVTDWGAFPRMFVYLNADSIGMPCGVGSGARRATLEGANHGGFNAVYSSFLSSFALNRQITLQMRKDPYCTIEMITTRGNGSATQPSCVPSSGFC